MTLGHVYITKSLTITLRIYFVSPSAVICIVLTKSAEKSVFTRQIPCEYEQKVYFYVHLSKCKGLFI